MGKARRNKLYIYAKLGKLHGMYSAEQWEDLKKAGTVTDEDIIEEVWAYE